MKNEIKNKIITYHIGGRAGSIGFPKINKFKNEIAHIIFDADESCIEQIKDSWDNAEVYPYFIGENDKKIEFLINYCPYTSSVLNFNEKFKDYYLESGKSDYVLGNVTETQKKFTIKTKSLDKLNDKKLIPKADFLSVDTQGSELEVLNGAKNLIHSSLLGINCEINFVEVYKNCQLFNEIDTLMKKNDFLLVEIISFDMGYKRIGRNYRGKGIPLQGEAMYFKDPNIIIKEKFIDPDLALIKLSFIALAFGYTEFAYDTIIKVKNINKFDSKYSSFLNDFKSYIEQDKNLPPLWHHIYSVEDSNNRFKSNRIKNNFFKMTPLTIIIKIKNRLLRYLKIILNFFFIDIAIIPPLSKFEKFLKENNFDIAVEEIRKRKMKY